MTLTLLYTIVAAVIAGASLLFLSLAGWKSIREIERVATEELRKVGEARREAELREFLGTREDLH